MRRRDFITAAGSLILLPKPTWAQEKLHRTLTLGQASVALGGKDLSKFDPNIYAGKWGDEAWINLNHRDTVVLPSSKQEIVGGRPTVTVGDIKHVFYPRTATSLEYELWLSAKPAKNWIRLEIQDSGGLRYLPQPALTPQQIAEGARRPEHIIGSIAVYYEKTGDFIGGAQYGTGKFGHWDRWKVTDANGKWSWCEDLTIDVEGGTMYLVGGLPATFMALAAYPVCVGPEFGYSTIGGSTKSVSADTVMLNPGYTGYAGTATSMAFYITDGDDVKLTLGLYSGTGNPRSLEGDTGEITVTNNVAAWYSDSFDSPFAIASGTTYHPAYCFESGPGHVNYDSGGGGYNSSGKVSYTYVAGTMASSVSPTFNRDELYSIKVTYTAAASGALPQVI